MIVDPDSIVLPETLTRSLPADGVSVTDFCPASSWTVMSAFAFDAVCVTVAGL